MKFKRIRDYIMGLSDELNKKDNIKKIISNKKTG